MPETATLPRSGLITTDNVPVPLTGVAIDAEISNLCARVTITQRYRQPGGEADRSGLPVSAGRRRSGLRVRSRHRRHARRRGSEGARGSVPHVRRCDGAGARSDAAGRGAAGRVPGQRRQPAARKGGAAEDQLRHGAERGRRQPAVCDADDRLTPLCAGRGPRRCGAAGCRDAQSSADVERAVRPRAQGHAVDGRRDRAHRISVACRSRLA